MLLNCGVRGDSWESFWLQRKPNQSTLKEILPINFKDWCWSWNSSTLATWCEELTHLKRPWCWERLKAGGERSDRGWDGWMASSAQWTWVWVNSRSGVGQGGLRCYSPWGRKSRTRLNDWTELNWTELNWLDIFLHVSYHTSKHVQQWTYNNVLIT